MADGRDAAEARKRKRGSDSEVRNLQELAAAPNDLCNYRTLRTRTSRYVSPCISYATLYDFSRHRRVRVRWEQDRRTRKKVARSVNTLYAHRKGLTYR